MDTSKKKQVLIYCGNGYIFDEIYLPLIEKNHNKWCIDLLISNYFVSDKVQGKINHLAQLNKINSYSKNIPIYINSIDSYKEIKQLFQLSRRSGED